MNVQKIFIELYRQYGPQGWWPTVRRKPHRAQNAKRKMQKLLPRPFRLPLRQGEKAVPRYFPGKYNRRLSEREKFEIAIGAILTQNTAWKNVEKAIACLHREGLMSPQAILNAPIAKLRKCIKSSGYFNQKTKKIKIFCRWLVEKHGGKLKKFFSHNSNLRHLTSDLQSLWGIGSETADSILLYAGGFPVFVVDAYTRRLCAEYGVRFKKYEEYQNFFTDGLKVFDSIGVHAKAWRLANLSVGLQHIWAGTKVALFQEYHALIVKWGKEYGLSRRS